MTLNELDLAYIYIGLKVRSKYTGNIGIVEKINKTEVKCLTHEEYHSFTIEIWFKDSNTLSVHAHCDFEAGEVI